MSDVLDRSHLDRLIEAARKHARRWESLSALEKREHNAATWEAIAGELNDMYIEQRTGRINFRLTQQDVFYARRVAVWMRFELELQTWRADESNAAAETFAKRAKLSTGAGAVLSDEVKARVATKPKAPDTRDPPLLPPDPADKPTDWPPMTGVWGAWIEELMRVRRPAPKRAPTNEEMEAAE